MKKTTDSQKAFAYRSTGTNVGTVKAAGSTGYSNIYQDITDKVLAALRQGDIIWRKPWSANRQRPANLSSGKTYRGWNMFYLSWMLQANNFPSRYFVTFKQAQALGGHIKKGSKGFPIIKWVVKNGNAPDDNEAVTDKAGRPTIYPITHIVFNVAQTENLNYPADDCTCEPVDKIAACEEILQHMGDRPPVISGGDQAAYSWPLDRIYMPERDSFHVSEEYYATLYHELIHSTGHPKRLARRELTENDGFGSETYSREELTAEFGAAYLCGLTGIVQKTIVNSAAYIKGWMQRLQSDPTLLVRATTKAQAAVDFLLPSPEKKEETRPLISEA